MAIQNFDELNKFREAATKWFDAMDITPEEKLARVNLSMDYCEIIIMLFQMITEQEYEREECVAFAKERLKLIAEREIGLENVAYINDWADFVANKVAAETYDKYMNEIEDYELEDVAENIAESDKTKTIYLKDLDVSIPEDEFLTSDERAYEMAIDYASTIYNYFDYIKAIDDGKTRKVWITENDEKVRETHQFIDHMDIPMDELFVVGNSYMRFPGDVLESPELKEIINCRCHLKCY